MIDLSAIEARLKAATPAPWAWGDDWATLERPSDNEFGGDKYAELSLIGNEGQEIIPLRVDHYEAIWDCRDPRNEPSAADRDIIAHAPSDLAALLELVRELQRRICPDVHRVLHGQCENCLAQFVEEG